MYDHNVRPSQTDRWTDRQTDGHHSNCATIRSNETYRAQKKLTKATSTTYETSKQHEQPEL